MNLNDSHVAKIEKQNDLALQRAFLTLCEEEVKAESKLECIREVKNRILVEIEIRSHDKK